jgi:nicotinamidase-related amidase
VEWDLRKTAVLLVGFQNDYFSSDGILRGVIEESRRVTRALVHTVELLEKLEDTPALLVETPIVFTENYDELEEPVGILKRIAELGAFQASTPGSETVPEIARFGSRLMRVPGKRGLNAFSSTDLEETLRRNGIRDVVLCGAVTSICIDSTGRSAHERGFRVSVLSDCTCSRTPFEQSFYCEEIFPLYGNVVSADAFLEGAS